MHYAALAVGESNLTSVSDLALLTPSAACYGHLRQPKEAIIAKLWDHHDRTRYPPPGFIAVIFPVMLL